jgi:hypothetical protein
LGWQETHEACPHALPTHGPYHLRVRPACGTRAGRLKTRLRTLPVFRRVKCTAQHYSGNNTSKQREMTSNPLPYHPRHFNSLPAQNPTSCRHFRPSQDSRNNHHHGGVSTRMAPILPESPPIRLGNLDRRQAPRSNKCVSSNKLSPGSTLTMEQTTTKTPSGSPKFTSPPPTTLDPYPSYIHES